MPSTDEVWLPGSFTKNFSWGQVRDGRGLVQLHSEIRDGFDGALEDVPRNTFRERVASSSRPDYIPLNFFLFNRPTDGVDYVVCDELVFQALNFPHSKGFDLLALFAFNLSLVGMWRGASPPQRRPAMWANAYIRERVAGTLDWDTKKINADDIENFIGNDPRYHAKTSRKIATNLNHQYLVGDLAGFTTPKIERWWVNALFLALHRIIEDRRLNGLETPDSNYGELLNKYGFLALTGRRSLEKDLAVKHLVRLYSACGGRDRFSDQLTEIRVSELQGFIERANDHRPGGAVHPSNPRILKTIPRLCAQLTVNVGFDFLSPEEIDHFNVEEFIQRKATDAMNRLKEKGVRPTMTADELMKITRER